MDERDYRLWIALLGDAAARFNLVVYTLCLIPNHFHLLVQTPDANISDAMHHLNGKYARRFNWRHALSGHVLQDRFHTELVQRQEHLLTLLHYIPLNPVRAQLVATADEWRWSTYLHICDRKPRPDWLNTALVLDHFPGQTAADRIQAYREFVTAEAQRSMHLAKHSKRYVDHTQDLAQAPPLEYLECTHPNRKAAILAAWLSRAYTREQIARHFAVSTRTVTRIVVAYTASLGTRRPA